MIKKSYKRLLEISDDYQQVTMPDSRYYRRNGKYYPSITHVLSSYPKGKYFEDWLKKVGYSAEWIVKKAAEEGTMVHEMIEDWLNGKEIKFLFSISTSAPLVSKLFSNSLVEILILFFQKLLNCFFLSEPRIAFFADFMFGIDGVYDNIGWSVREHLC